MAKQDKTHSTGSAADLDASEDENVDRAFDLWLMRGLHQLYDMVAQEPIPDELLQLIEQDKTTRKA